MDFLTKEISRLRCELCGNVGDAHTEFEHDEMSSEVTCKNCGHTESEPALPRPAEWWSVAVYETDIAYGGPEEGGWYYDCGTWTEKHKTRIFEDYEAAIAYAESLRLWMKAEGYPRDFRVCSYTEQMPEAYFPAERPYYC